jgi:hypothetical protein
VSCAIPSTPIHVELTYIYRLLRMHLSSECLGLPVSRPIPLRRRLVGSTLQLPSPPSLSLTAPPSPRPIRRPQASV